MQWNDPILSLIKVCCCSKYFEWIEILADWLWCTTRVCFLVGYEVSGKEVGQRLRKINFIPH